MHFTGTNKKYAPFFIYFPLDLTCWHIPKKSSILRSEQLHIALLTSRARLGDIYTTTEIEKMLLALPEKAKRSKAARLGALRRQLERQI